MESDLRYFRRRAAAEALAAKRSMTSEARDRHLELAARYLSLVHATENVGSTRNEPVAA